MEKMWITKKVLLYIEDNLDKALTLEEIAAEFQYSRFYVARKFRESTGVTLHKYIQGRRLDEAARKLAETRQPSPRSPLRRDTVPSRHLPRHFV